ncbi:MAG: B12-binding domain-containing radical SAM protein [Candidatus Helarchaeota archaeon]
MNEKRVLFAHCDEAKGYSLWAKKDDILANPKFDKYYDKEFLEKTLGDSKRGTLQDLIYTIGNLGGEFISQNIESPSQVINDPISTSILEKHVQEFNPTHVGFSVVFGAYTTFLECVNFLRKKYPKIEIIVGGPGALIPGIDAIADHVCKGEGSIFVRKLLGEKTDTPLRIPRTIVKRFRPSPFDPKKYVETPMAALTTNLGCSHGCDFCITAALYGRNHVIGDAQEIVNALIEMGDMLNQDDVSVVVTDPIAFIDQKKWEKVISLMKGQNHCFHLAGLTTSTLIRKYLQPGGLFDKFKRSEEFQVTFLEIGIESFKLKYNKNRNIEWKSLVSQLHGQGIVSALSLIVGYDYHDHHSAIEEVKQAIEIDSSILHVVNLRILYETKLWYEYQEQGRLLDVPPEFRMLWGYQAFKHPHFRPGFVDCLPLMLEIDDLIRSNYGNYYARAVDIIKNRPKTPYNDKLIKIGEAMRKISGN